MNRDQVVIRLADYERRVREIAERPPLTREDAQVIVDEWSHEYARPKASAVIRKLIAWLETSK